jgi:hypothetical protein
MYYIYVFNVFKTLETKHCIICLEHLDKAVLFLHEQIVSKKLRSPQKLVLGVQSSNTVFESLVAET